MSPVIKIYVYIPIPVLITDKPIKGVNLEWHPNPKQSTPSKLSASLFQHLSRRAFVRSAWWN